MKVKKQLTIYSCGFVVHRRALAMATWGVNECVTYKASQLTCSELTNYSVVAATPGEIAFLPSCVLLADFILCLLFVPLFFGFYYFNWETEKNSWSQKKINSRLRGRNDEAWVKGTFYTTRGNSPRQLSKPLDWLKNLRKKHRIFCICYMQIANKYSTLRHKAALLFLTTF